MDLVRLIEGSLSDDLLKPVYRIDPSVDRFAGHCYVASEAYYHLRMRAGNPPPIVKRIRHEGVTHWWVETPKKGVVDITALQFRTPVPYEQGVRTGFLTKKPSKRAQEVIRRVGRLRRMLERFERAGFPEPDEVRYARLCGDSYSRGIWGVPLYARLWVVPPHGANEGHAELRLSHQILDRTLLFRCEISIEEAKELTDQL